MGGIPCHPPPISFFFIHHFFPSSLFSGHLAVLSLHPFFYIFVDVYCSDAVRHKSHYLRIVGSGTRLRGQRDTDERGFPRYLESLPPYFHRHRFTHSHKATRFSEKPFARSRSTIGRHDYFANVYGVAKNPAVSGSIDRWMS